MDNFFLHPWQKQALQNTEAQRQNALERLVLDQAEQLNEKEKTISTQIVIVLFLIVISLASISRVVELQDINTELNNKIALVQNNDK